MYTSRCLNSFKDINYSDYVKKVMSIKGASSTGQVGPYDVAHSSLGRPKAPVAFNYHSRVRSDFQSTVELSLLPYAVPSNCRPRERFSQQICTQQYEISITNLHIPTIKDTYTILEGFWKLHSLPQTIQLSLAIDSSMWSFVSSAIFSMALSNWLQQL